MNERNEEEGISKSEELPPTKPKDTGRRLHAFAQKVSTEFLSTFFQKMRELLGCLL